MSVIYAVVYGLLVWWLGTSLVLMLGRLPEQFGSRMRIGTLFVFVATTAGLLAVQRDPGVHAAYAAFTLGVASWGALELAYFSGWLTGPSPHACPPGMTPWQRFRAGIMTSLHHEIAVIATAIVLVAAAGPQGQNTGTATFVLLWLMRWSAKLNLFLGVRNFSTHMLPEPMRYLDSHVRRASMNPLFPVSIIAAGIVLAMLLSTALSTEVAMATQAHHLLLATLLGLAIVEHVLLMVPISDRLLWSWAMADEGRR